MKLRTKKNALRLRLNKDDIAELKQEGKVTEIIHFGHGNKPLIYSLCRERYAERISTEFNGNEILVMIPDQMAIPWIDTDKEGFSHEQDIGNGQTLNITIEKDFKCLIARSGEDEHKNFPNPLAEGE